MFSKGELDIFNNGLSYYVHEKSQYMVSIKSFPDFKHLLQENYVEYKYIFLPVLVTNLMNKSFIL
jgi:hypothetical protein